MGIIKQLANNFRKNKSEEIKKQELSFYQLLEDDYYDAYPEQWDKEINFAVGAKFVSVLNGETKNVIIPGYEGEEVTSSYIKRGKRILWKIGKTYYVCKQLNSDSKDNLIKKSNDRELREFTQTIGPSESIGQITLVEIIPNGLENILIFN